MILGVKEIWLDFWGIKKCWLGCFGGKRCWLEFFTKHKNACFILKEVWDTRCRHIHFHLAQKKQKGNKREGLTWCRVQYCGRGGGAKQGPSLIVLYQIILRKIENILMEATNYLMAESFSGRWSRKVCHVLIQMSRPRELPCSLVLWLPSDNLQQRLLSFNVDLIKKTKG